MTLKQATLGAALVMALAGTASAGTTWMGVTGGAGVPTGDYADMASKGWHIGATGMHWMNPTWGFGGNLSYHAWSASDQLDGLAEAAFGPGSNYHWGVTQATAHLMASFNTQGQMKPYALAGMGVYRISSRLESPSGNETVTAHNLGFCLGAGMTMPAAGTSRWGFETTYHMVPADKEFGSNLSFVTMSASYMWNSWMK
jgi:opacity protein-like surface antigen